MSPYQYFSGYENPSIFNTPSTSDHIKLPIAATLLSTLLWTAFYFLLLALLNDRAKTASNIVALVHGYLLLAHVAYVTKTGSGYYTNPGATNTNQDTLTICVTLGFFLYDYGMFIVYKFKQGVFVNISHLFSIITLTIVLLKGQSATEIIYATVLFKIPNTVLPTLAMIGDAGYNDCFPVQIVYLTAIVVVFLFMLGFGAEFMYVVCKHSQPGLGIKFCVVGLVLMAWYMLAKRGKKAYYKYIDSLPSVEHHHKE